MSCSSLLWAAVCPCCYLLHYLSFPSTCLAPDAKKMASHGLFHQLLPFIRMNSLNKPISRCVYEAIYGTWYIFIFIIITLYIHACACVFVYVCIHMYICSDWDKFLQLVFHLPVHYRFNIGRKKWKVLNSLCLANSFPFLRPELIGPFPREIFLNFLTMLSNVTLFYLTDIFTINIMHKYNLNQFV